MARNRNTLIRLRRQNLINIVPQLELRFWSRNDPSVTGIPLVALRSHIVNNWKAYESDAKDFVSYCWENDDG